MKSVENLYAQFR